VSALPGEIARPGFVDSAGSVFISLSLQPKMHIVAAESKYVNNKFFIEGAVKLSFLENILFNLNYWMK
jgi:hypothetical protein